MPARSLHSPPLWQAAEVEELTGRRWVPVLVHGGDVIHDSHRIPEYLNWLEQGEEVA
jgi:glutathione S-transferase